jgi:hypothetical protein
MNPASLPPEVVILQMLTGKWVSQALTVAARLGVADPLAKGPLTAAQLAEATGAHPRSLHRLLRALASVGVFQQDPQGRFAHTPLSSTLQSDVPGSMRGMAMFIGDRWTWDAWRELDYSVRTGRSAVQKVHGQLPFEYLKAHPDDGRTFDQAMTAFSQQELQGILSGFDFSGVPTLADVGGGQGALLLGILGKNPGQRGILFDQPDVIAAAGPRVQASGLADRCQLQGGDFFGSLPAADGYTLKHILHDWNDDDALRILQAIQRASRPGARVFVLEAVIGPGNEYDFAKLMDLEMLVFYDGGLERTEEEYRTLLDQAGFTLQRTQPTASPCHVLEAVRR